MRNLREKTRIARHKRIRKRIKSSPEQPRLCIHRSLKNIYLQVIDDQRANTLFSLSTLSSQIKDKMKYGGNIKSAHELGVIAAQKLKEKGKDQNVYTLSDAERQRWIDTGGKPIWAKWVKTMEGKGYTNAQAVLDATMELLK